MHPRGRDTRRPFSPLAMPGLGLWLDAADQGTLGLSSGAVATWYDKSPAGRNFTQSTAGARPAWALTSLGGRWPGVTFDGVDDFLSLGQSIQYNAGSCTVFMTCTGAGIGTSRYVFSEGSTGSATPVYSLFRNSATASNGAVQYTTDAGTNVLSAASTNPLSFDSNIRILCRYDDGANIYGRRGGAAIVGPSAYVRATTTLNTCCIGGRAKATPDSFAAITIAELLVYTRVLDTREINQIEGYLKRCGGALTQNGHPWQQATP